LCTRNVLIKRSWRELLWEFADTSVSRFRKQHRYFSI